MSRSGNVTSSAVAMPACPTNAPAPGVDRESEPEHGTHDSTLAQKVLVAVWYTVAVLLIVHAFAYFAIQVRHGVSLLVFIGMVAIIASVVLLFFGEGSEIAVAMLINNDPEQFDFNPTLKPAFEKLWEARRKNSPAFIIGRQLLVVVAVVVPTFLCVKLAEIPAVDVSELQFGHSFQVVATFVDAWLRKPGVVLAFDLAFPTFLALWVAQLPAKLIAHEDPVRAFAWPLTRSVVEWSLVVGSRLRIERLSGWLTAWLRRRRRETGGSLLPGRRHYYETSALLRGGTALAKADISMVVAKDGSAKVCERLEFHAFQKGMQHIPQQVFWEARFADYEEIVFTKWPPQLGDPPRTPGVPSKHRQLKDGTKMHVLKWDLKFPLQLPAETDIAFELNYTTESGAWDTKYRDENEYFYSVNQMPTKELVVRISPAPDARFTLIAQLPVSARASEESEVNDREARLVKVSAENGTLCFRASYPLLNTRFGFGWEIGPR